MTYDLLFYLSGRVPGGLYALVSAILLFAVIWLTVWFGTKFYSKKRLYAVLVMGTVSITAVYMSVWMMKPPLPIPQRVMLIMENEKHHPSTQMYFLYYLTEMRIRNSPERFALLTDELFSNPPRMDDEERILDWIKWNRLKWCVFVSEVDEENESAKLTIFTRRGRSLNVVHSHRLTGDESPMKIANKVDEAIIEIEKKSSKTIFRPFPSFVSYEDASAYYEGLALLERDQYQIGSDTINSIAEKYPTWKEPRIQLIKYWLKNNPNRYYDSLRFEFESIVTSDKDNKEVLIYYGIWAVEYRQWETAESALRLYQNYFPQDPQVYYYLSKLSDQRLKSFIWNKQTAILKYALYLAPCYERARVSLAKWLMSHQKHHNALKMIERGLEFNPEATSLLRTKAVAKLETYKPDEAEQVLKKLIQIAPQDASAYYNLGISYYALEKFPEAIESFKTSLELGGTIENLYYLGVCYQRLEDWEQAIHYFQRRAANLTHSQDFYAHKARERVQIIRAIMETDSTVQ